MYEWMLLCLKKVGSTLEEKASVSAMVKPFSSSFQLITSKNSRFQVHPVLPAASRKSLQEKEELFSDHPAFPRITNIIIIQPQSNLQIHLSFCIIQPVYIQTIVLIDLIVDNFLILNMLSHRLTPRLDMNQLQTNILMTQIRAEKKNYECRKEHPTFLQSHREQNGKKQFKQILYRPSLSPSSKQGGTAISPFSRGRNRQYQDSHRSRSGKRMAVNIENCSPKHSVEREQRWGKRRFDHSPNHQHARTHINLCWK